MRNRLSERGRLYQVDSTKSSRPSKKPASLKRFKVTFRLTGGAKTSLTHQDQARFASKFRFYIEIYSGRAYWRDLPPAVNFRMKFWKIFDFPKFGTFSSLLAQENEFFKFILVDPVSISRNCSKMSWRQSAFFANSWKGLGSANCRGVPKKSEKSYFLS